MAWIAWDTDQIPPITEADKENNVNIIAAFFRNEGWTDNAIAAMLGNMDAESFINPGQFELYHNYNMAFGFGLVQWTPATKFSDYAGYNWRTDYDAQLDRIRYEWGNEIQWGGTVAMTFHQFAASTDSVDYLTYVFLRNYEAPLDWEGTLPYRRARANHWFEYLGNTPTPGHIPIWMYFKIRWDNFKR